MQKAIRFLFHKTITWLIFLVLLLAVGEYFHMPEDETVIAEPYNGIPLPVIMYHSLVQDSRHAGPSAVSPAVFEQDLLYLKELGYETVLPQELIAYVEGRGELPEKPVMITFDDGFYNNLVYALPILEKLDMQAVVSILGFTADYFSENDDKSLIHAYLSWEDIIALQESGRIELGNHSNNLHLIENGRKGVMKKEDESKDTHRQLLLEDIGGLQDKFIEHCSIAPSVFAYPYGMRDGYSEAVLQELGFSVLLTSYERMNYLTRDIDALRRIGRYNRPSGISTYSFMQNALGG